jgi:SPW repeat
MRNPRHHAILEIYQLVLAAFLFVSPWLFAFAHGTLRLDTWVSAALVAAISVVALVAFREWEEWIACILGLWIAVSPWVLGKRLLLDPKRTLPVRLLTLD